MKKLGFVILLTNSLYTMAQQKPVSALPFSKTASANGLLFISGQIGVDLSNGQLVTTSFEAEAKQVMFNLRAALKENGLNFNDLINVTIYLKTMSNYQVTNQVYSSYFNGKFPARVCIAVADLPSHANIEISGIGKISSKSAMSNKVVMQQFLKEVRSGKDPDKASLYMADTILAHQMNAEDEGTVKRTPENYAEHVKEFLKMYGKFSFDVTELIAENDKVYVRWKQTGKHLTEIDGHKATGEPLTEIASAVYRLKNGKITEYWIQTDRFGFEKQLQSK
jgi:reactive intermediate/imine deaminase